MQFFTANQLLVQEIVIIYTKVKKAPDKFRIIVHYDINIALCLYLEIVEVQQLQNLHLLIGTLLMEV